MEFADEVYIFTSEDKEGFKFYDRSPSRAEQEFAGELPEGVFITDKYSLESAKWDDEINIPNGTKIVRYRDGSNNATTYIVSEEKYQEILDKLLTASKENGDRIIIDTREIDKQKSEYNTSDRSQHERTSEDNIRSVGKALGIDSDFAKIAGTMHDKAHLATPKDFADLDKMAEVKESELMPLKKKGLKDFIKNTTDKKIGKDEK